MVLGLSVSDVRRTDPVVKQLETTERAVRFSLLYRGHRFELKPGTLVIGRGTGCQLVLDDALVSRKHAELEVTESTAVLVDLGSVNGVFVNGLRVSGRRPLIDGDKLVIGQQEMTIFAAVNPSLLPESPTARLSADTLVGLESPLIQAAKPAADESEATHQGDALSLLGGVVDKVLALGRGDEAERIIGPYLRNYLATAQKASSASPEAAEKAVGYAVKLAAATRKGEWIDYAFALYTVCRRPLPGPVVDQLYTVLRQVSGLNINLLRGYVAVLRSVSARLGPNERFLAQRIEGLERLASA
ncbi:MAG: FHA domain-containing protein [Sorangiineae bacterium PRO1]|nr:FHA domain-containing protein [Sorangiineae bacterium PRO1]